jgi:hypothetical protein
MSDRNPFEGPLAGITGRLQKLREENTELRFSSDSTDVAAKVDRLIFEVGMLIDLVDELAWSVTPLLPESGA